MKCISPFFPTFSPPSSFLLLGVSPLPPPVASAPQQLSCQPEKLRFFFFFFKYFSQLQLSTYHTHNSLVVQKTTSQSFYQLFLFLLSLDFLNFLLSLCALTCTGLHGFRERERGELRTSYSPVVQLSLRGVYICGCLWIFHNLNTFLEVKLTMSATLVL